MRKPHLFSSEEPWIHWGIQLKALCGREVEEAVCMASVDGNEDCWISAKNLCEKCKYQKQERYVYLIREGQLVLDEAVTA